MPQQARDAGCVKLRAGLTSETQIHRECILVGMISPPKGENWFSGRKSITLVLRIKHRNTYGIETV